MTAQISKNYKKFKYLLEKLILNQYRNEKNADLYETLIISVAHALMSAMFPRLVLSPLHIAVSVSLHKKFGSKEFIDNVMRLVSAVLTVTSKKL